MTYALNPTQREEYRWFEPNPAAPRQARHFVLDTLAEWNAHVESDLAELVTSELATNAVCHAHTKFRVGVVQTHPDVLRIEVSDADCQLPSENLARSSDHTSGRGLQLVSDVSRRWGVLEADDGKTVWCALDVTPKN